MTPAPRLLLSCVLSAALALSACGDEPAPDASALPDSAAASQVAPDTVVVAVQDSAEGPLPDSAVSPSTDSVTATSSVSPQITLSDSALAVRLERLEETNDSLRAAIGTLLARVSPDEDSGLLRGISETVPGAAPDSAASILEVGNEQVRHWGLRIFVAILFLVLVGLVVRGAVWLLDRLAERNARSRLFFKRLVPIVRIAVWTLALVFVAMVIMQVDAQGLVAAGAAVGVAVGFAAQDILKNVFGGLIVLFDQPFQVGDKISVGGTYGEVVSIGLRSTRLATPDDNLVSVPNSQVVGDQVSNANAGALNCQVVTDLFLPGHVDDALAKRIAFEAAAGSRYLFRKKPVVVLVKDLFEHTFHTRIRVKAYVLDPRLEFLFQSDVTERARAGFREAGLMPSQDSATPSPAPPAPAQPSHGPSATPAARPSAPRTP